MQYGWFLTKGHRWNMEDMHIAEFRELPQGDSAGLFAVYDGHGGKKCVQYIHKNLFDVVLSEPTFRQGDVEAAMSASHPVILFSKLYKMFFGYFYPEKYVFFTMKRSNCRDELIDILDKTATLVPSSGFFLV